jgi:hypothetical protein
MSSFTSELQRYRVEAVYFGAPGGKRAAENELYARQQDERRVDDEPDGVKWLFGLCAGLPLRW